MLLQSGVDFNFQFSVLDPDPNAPCKGLTDFQVGKLTDYDTVMAFGKACDVITIEIENVNTQALKDLERQGKKVFPQPHCIELIQDKRLQKTFYKEQGIPTAEFVLTQSKADVYNHESFLPAVHKLGKEGYDGRGVQVLASKEDLPKAFELPGLLEKFVDFEKEISVLVARNEQGQVITYPAVEMVFHPVQNLVEYLFAPAQLPTTVLQQADDIAKKIIQSLDMVGLLAVEMFITKSGDVLVNEIAPRPHNSGHQTIEANITSQYEQHLRAITNLPLGDTHLLIPSAMINLLGEPGYTGNAQYQGFTEVMNISGVHVHLYGKKITKPFRKMGHVTIIDHDLESLRQKANFVKETLKVIA